MDTKICPKCSIEKPVSEFYKNKSCKDGLGTYCKKCANEAQKKYIQSHPDKHKEHYTKYAESHRDRLRASARKRYYANLDAERERQKIRQREKTREIHKFKTPCVKCGESRLYTIDFHHIDPSDKKYNISQITKNMGQLSSELSKCVCLCRNCHAEFHWTYGNNPIYPVESLGEYIGRDPYEISVMEVT